MWEIYSVPCDSALDKGEGCYRCATYHKYSVLMKYLRNENVCHRHNEGDWFPSLGQAVSTNGL
jgi:hypothetical protein